MASIQQRITAVAHTLITAAGMAHAVSATDIRASALQLHKEYQEWTQVDITSKIAAEIRQRHSAGISGSL